MSDKSYGVVYLVTNSVNGKQYVGQTTGSVSRRWSRAETSRSLLGAAFRKYGRESFVFKEVAKAGDRKTLDRLEQKWIAKLKTIAPDGYNLTTGGNSVGLYCEQSKKKMSETRKNMWADPDRRKELASIGDYRQPSEDHSESMKKIWSDPKRKRKYSAAIRAGQNTQQAKENFSKAHKATWSDPDYKARMSAVHKAMSPDKREALRLASKAARQRPEVKAERSRLAKAMWADPAFRSKIAETKAQLRAARTA